MTTSARQRFARRLSRFNLSYSTTSWLLFAAMVVGGLTTLYLVADWRHSLMVTKACDSFPTPTGFCVDTKGLEGWVAAVAEAVPPTGFIMLMMLGGVYALFGKQLDLVSWGDRRDTLCWTCGTIAVLSALMLMMMGAATVYFP